jgi:uncharacterized protein (TIGR02001 family)
MSTRITRTCGAFLALVLAGNGGAWAQEVQEGTVAKPNETTTAAEEEAGSWLPGEFNANVSATNNYMFRGVSQTNNNPALQGGIGYEVETGLLGSSFFGGLWASNVDFNDGDDGANLEMDWSFGLKGDVADTGIGWSLAGVYYYYPGADNDLNYDYWEVIGGLSYDITDWLSISPGFAYSPDFFGSTGNAYYPSLAASVKVPLIPKKWFDLRFDFATGHQFIEDRSKAGFGKSYQDWSMGPVVTIKGIDISAKYVDSGLSKSDCFSGTNLCGPRAVVAVGASF